MIPVVRRIDNPHLVIASLPIPEHLEGNYERRRLHPPHPDRQAPTARQPRHDGLAIPVEEPLDPNAVRWSHSRALDGRCSCEDRAAIHIPHRCARGCGEAEALSAGRGTVAAAQPVPERFAARHGSSRSSRLPTVPLVQERRYKRSVPSRATITAFLGTLAALAALTLAPANAVAATTTLRPVIVSLTITGPRPLPAAGTSVVMTVRVEYATTCTFMRQFSAFSSLYAFKTVSCASGRATVVVPAIANSNKAARRLTYAVRVRGAGTASVQRSVTVPQAAAASRPSPSPTPTPSPTPPSTSPTATLSISPGSVPSTGGTVVLTFTSSNATTCTLASAPLFWTTGANPVTVDCTGTYIATLNSTTTQQQWTFTFTAANVAGQSASATQTLTELAPAPAPTPPSTAWAESPNWSGYIVPSTSDLVTDASGAFTVPTLDCSVTPDGGASFWVGIGGEQWSTGGSSGALLQTGVTTDCVGGVAQYAGWFELFPSSPNTDVYFRGFPVSPGDQIVASVFQGSTGAWETKVDDLSTGLSGVMVTGEGWGVSTDGGNGSFLKQGSTVNLSYAGGYTAEWIAEDYTEPDGVTMIPFADYGSVTFSDLRTSLTSWYLTVDEGVAIAQDGVVLSTPSAPANDGFSVSYTG